MRDSGSVIVASATQAKSAPKVDAPIPRPSARPAMPAFAIGWPSKVVITFAGVPGMRSSVAEMRPPVIDPVYIDTRRFMASIGVM
jgi:hypothetical protein